MASIVDLLALSRRVTAQYGINVTFTRVAEGAFVPSTGAVGAGTTTTYTANLIHNTYTAREINNTTILQGDVVAYLEPNLAGYIPLVGDTASISGKVYRVIMVSASTLQATSLLYKIQLRI